MYRRIDAEHLLHRITMYNDYSAVSFDYSVSATGVQIIPEIGVKLPLHCTSQGKLLLAYLPDRKIISMLRDKQLIQYTPHTIVDTDRLLTEISEIRSMGYAVEDGEYKYRSSASLYVRARQDSAPQSYRHLRRSPA